VNIAPRRPNNSLVRGRRSSSRDRRVDGGRGDA
jgi:hypothetical protein